MRKKVLIYTECYIYGGSERLMLFLLKNRTVNSNFDFVFAYRKHKDYVRLLKKDLKKFNVEVDCYPLYLFSNSVIFYKIGCLKIPDVLKSLLKIPFFLIEKSGIYFLFNISTFIFLIKRVKPNIIHINNGGYPAAKSCNQFALGSKLCGISSIVYQVNNIAYPPNSIFSKLYDRIIGRCVKYFITASEKARDALVINRQFDNEKVIQIANTIMAETIDKDRTQILNEMKLPSDSFLLVQVAFLTHRKGQVYLLNAFNNIKKSDKEKLFDTIKLILVGDGEDMSLLINYVNENELNDDVFFTGYKSNSVDYINACDIFLLPSVANEDMPLALLTAMSCGKTIISTKVAGIGEVINHNESGILTNPDPTLLVGEIEEAIINLFNSANFRSRLGNNAKLAFEERYSEMAYGFKICNLYNLSLNSFRAYK